MNQKNIDETYYMSEDKVKCRKGRTEVYILNKKSLNIHGPKILKFGEPFIYYYFLSKEKAEKLRDRIIKRKMNYRIKRYGVHDTPIKTK